MGKEFPKTDVLAALYPFSAVQIVQIGQPLQNLELILKTVTVIVGKQEQIVLQDHQIGADVKKLFTACRSCVAVEFLPGDVVVPVFQKAMAFDHGNRGYVVRTFSDQFHLVSWRQVPDDYPDAISLYVATPITDPRSPRFRFDPAFCGEKYNQQMIALYLTK